MTRHDEAMRNPDRKWVGTDPLRLDGSAMVRALSDEITTLRQQVADLEAENAKKDAAHREAETGLRRAARIAAAVSRCFLRACYPDPEDEREWWYRFFLTVDLDDDKIFGMIEKR